MLYYDILKQRISCFIDPNDDILIYGWTPTGNKGQIIRAGAQYEQEKNDR